MNMPPLRGLRFIVRYSTKIPLLTELARARNMKQNSYEMIIWWSAEYEAFVVDVPELPGCMAHGATRQAAIKNAEDAIKFWVKTAKEDGAEIPEPRGRLVFA